MSGPRDGMEIMGPSSSGDSFDVTLPVTRAEFADFLNKVLGGKDKLEQRFPGKLYISADLVTAIEGALTERVETQNGGRLISSRYNVNFSNGRGFKTSSLEQLLALSPAGEVHTLSLYIELIYLINYPGVTAPVREKISLTFAMIDLDPDWNVVARHNGHARCEIEYYNRVFAEDCINTVNSVMQTAHTPYEVSVLQKTGAILGDRLAPATASVCGMVYCLAVITVGNMFQKMGGADGNLQQLITDRTYPPHVVAVFMLAFIFIGLAFAILPPILLESLSGQVKIYDLTFGLYKHDRALIENLAKKKSRQKLAKIFAIVGSLLLSLLGAYIYDYLMGRIQ